MDKELLRRLGIGNAAADFIEDQNAKHAALGLLTPGTLAAGEIKRMQDACDPMRTIREAERRVFYDLSGAFKHFEQQQLSASLGIAAADSFKIGETAKGLFRMKEVSERLFHDSTIAKSWRASSLASEALKNRVSLGATSQMAREAFERSTNFALPTLTVTKGYLEVFQRQQAEFLRAARVSILGGGVGDALARMRSPWLDLNNVTGSISGVVGLHALGQSLFMRPSFDIETTKFVRSALGDWRDFTSTPGVSVHEPEDREGLYRERGLEPTLVGFPAQAFDQLAEDTGLTTESSAVLALFDAEIPVADFTAAEQHRTNVAFQRLLSFELYLRCFINDAMTSAFGEDWPRHRLPNGIHDGWQEKRSKAEAQGGNVCRLIDYADFTHYLLIIQKADNWKTVFKSVFNRKEDVVESLQRLAPLRVDTMHARPLNITNADLLMLYVETTRIVGATRMHAGRLQ